MWVKQDFTHSRYSIPHGSAIIVPSPKHLTHFYATRISGTLRRHFPLAPAAQPDFLWERLLRTSHGRSGRLTRHQHCASRSFLVPSASGRDNLTTQTEQFHFSCSKMNSSKVDSSKLNNPPSLNPLLNINTDSDQIPVLEPGYKEINQNLVVKGGRWGMRECEGERGFPIFRIDKFTSQNLKPFQVFCQYSFAAYGSWLIARYKKAFVPRRFY